MTLNHPKDEVSTTDRRADRVEASRHEVGESLIRKVDICRGLFAFLVVAAHSYDVCYVIHPEALAALPESVRHVLFFTLQCGFYWVMGFFVISGYCIQLSVGRQVESGRFSLGVYLLARLTRIMPLYYAGLLFTLLVEVSVAPIRPSFYPEGLNHVGWLAQVVFAQRLFQTFGSFAPSWTITYELFYYIFFGLLAALSPRFKLRPSWLGMGLCVAIGGLMQFLYVNGGKNGFTLHAGLIFGLGAIWFMGALVSVHGPEAVRYRSVRNLARAWPLVFGSAAILWGENRCPLQVVYLILGVAFSMMMLRFQAAEVLEGSRSREAPRWLSSTAKLLGLASYPTYLFHGPILLLVATGISQSGLKLDWRVSWLLLVSTGVGSGISLGWLAERPIMSWRAGFLKRLKESPDPRLRALSTPRLEIPR